MDTHPRKPTSLKILSGYNCGMHIYSNTRDITVNRTMDRQTSYTVCDYLIFGSLMEGHGEANRSSPSDTEGLAARG